MFVISKKRVSIILCCLLLGIFAYSYSTIKMKDNSKIQQTTAIPTSSKVIVVDAGHGKPDEGAESSTRYNRSGN